MGASTSNNFTSKQTVANNITQYNQATCIATVEASSGGNIIIIDGSHIGGSVIGSTQKITTDASCIMHQSNDANIESILESMSKQTNTNQNGVFDFLSKLIGDKVKNKVEIDQTITNTITQINTSTCSSNIISSTKPNYIYVKNSSILGSVIGSTTEASATSSCTITNGASAVVYNKELSKNDQNNKSKSLFFTIVIAFTVIMVVMILGVIILFSTGAIGSIGYKSLKMKKKEQIAKTAQPIPPTQLQPIPPQLQPIPPTQLQPLPQQYSIQQLQPTQLRPLPQQLPLQRI